MISLIDHDSQWGRSQVVVIYSDSCSKYIPTCERDYHTQWLIPHIVSGKYHIFSSGLTLIIPAKETGGAQPLTE